MTILEMPRTMVRPFSHKIYDHCIQIDILRKWAAEVEFNGVVYSNVVYCGSEQDAVLFALRWS
jgi:hypothetical protein